MLYFCSSFNDDDMLRPSRLVNPKAPVAQETADKIEEKKR